jgi:hypothetical protein
MSAWGWPEPSTGIRFPRGQWSQLWIALVSWFSSRIARSRYFSLISSSVAGTWAETFDGPAPPPLVCIISCAPWAPSSG